MSFDLKTTTTTTTTLTQGNTPYCVCVCLSLFLSIKRNYYHMPVAIFISSNRLLFVCLLINTVDDDDS